MVCLLIMIVGRCAACKKRQLLSKRRKIACYGKLYHDFFCFAEKNLVLFVKNCGMLDKKQRHFAAITIYQ